MTVPIMTHFNWEKKILVKTNSSDLTLSSVFSQNDDDGIQCPVTFYTKKHSPTEANYEIYKKELMTII